MGHMQKDLEACLLAGHDEHAAAVFQVDALSDEEWAAFQVQADTNARELLKLMASYGGMMLSQAEQLVLISSGRVDGPRVLGAVRLGLALFCGHALSPHGRDAAERAEWLSPNKDTRQKELIKCTQVMALMLADPDHRVRIAAVQSLSTAVVTQQMAVSLAKEDILGTLSHSSSPKSGAIREDALMAIRVCYKSAAAEGHDPPLPRNTLLTIASMTIDADENVRAAARAALADVIQLSSEPRHTDRDNSEFRRVNDLLEGLVRGWFSDPSDTTSQNHDNDEGGLGEQGGDEVGPRSILLLLGGFVVCGAPRRVCTLTVAQQLSARSAVARVVPPGYAPAIHAALHLMQSGGGEGEIEEAEDLGAVAGGASAIAILGPGLESQLVFSKIVQRMRCSDTPLAHLPLLATALHRYGKQVLFHLYTSPILPRMRPADTLAVRAAARLRRRGLPKAGAGGTRMAGCRCAHRALLTAKEDKELY
jgi:hypothetical protein